MRTTERQGVFGGEAILKWFGHVQNAAVGTGCQEA